MSEIKPGDVVYLKSGSPAMTVSSHTNGVGNVKCVCFIGDKAEYVEVRPEALTKDDPNPKTARTRALAL